MATYRITLTDRTGRRIGVIPPYGQTPLQYSTVLNGGGSATLTPKLTLPLWSGPRNRTLLSSWASEIVIERLTGPGTKGIVWEGPVTKPHADLDSDALSVGASPAWAWFGERDIDTRHAYGGHDQIDICRDLMTEYGTAKRGPAWDLRMTFAAGSSGTKTTQAYLPTDNQVVSTAIENLAGSSNGFDFEVISSFDGNGRVRRFWQWYAPQKGRRLTQRLVRGRGGLRAFSIEEATQIATRARGSTISYQTTPNAALEARYGVHSKSVALTDSNSKTKLRAEVDDYLRYRTPPANIVSFQFLVSRQTPHGFIQTGDTVPVLAERGWASYDADVRVIGLSYSVDKDGREMCTCTAAGVPGGLS